MRLWCPWSQPTKSQVSPNPWISVKSLRITAVSYNRCNHHSRHPRLRLTMYRHRTNQIICPCAWYNLHRTAIRFTSRRTTTGPQNRTYLSTNRNIILLRIPHRPNIRSCINPFHNIRLHINLHRNIQWRINRHRNSPQFLQLRRTHTATSPPRGRQTMPTITTRPCRPTRSSWIFFKYTYCNK